MTSAKLASVADLASQPCRRADKRVALDTAARWRPVGDEAWRIGLVEDASLGGIRLDLAAPETVRCGDWIELGLPLVGDVTARVIHTSEATLGLAFEDVAGEARDRLIRVLSTRRHPVRRADPA